MTPAAADSAGNARHRLIFGRLHSQIQPGGQSRVGIFNHLQQRLVQGAMEMSEFALNFLGAPTDAIAEHAGIFAAAWKRTRQFFRLPQPANFMPSSTSSASPVADFPFRRERSEHRDGAWTGGPFFNVFWGEHRAAAFRVGSAAAHLFSRLACPPRMVAAAFAVAAMFLFFGCENVAVAYRPPASLHVEGDVNFARVFQPLSDWLRAKNLPDFSLTPPDSPRALGLAK